MIESAFTCVSPGTELRRLRGKEALGDVRFPFVPGYCLAGRVLSAGPGVDLAPGTPVITCGTVDAGGLGLSEGGHVSHAVAPVETVVEVPGNVDLLDASLAILGGICYHGLQQSRPQATDKVAAVGLGAIGQLSGAPARYIWRGSRRLRFVRDPRASGERGRRPFGRHLRGPVFRLFAAFPGRGRRRRRFHRNSPGDSRCCIDSSKTELESAGGQRLLPVPDSGKLRGFVLGSVSGGLRRSVDDPDPQGEPGERLESRAGADESGPPPGQRPDFGRLPT